jgi:hypothetical protein
MRSRIELPGHLIGDNTLKNATKAVVTFTAKIEEAKKKHDQCLAEVAALGEPPDRDRYGLTWRSVESKFRDIDYRLGFPIHTGEDAVRVARDWDKFIAVLDEAQKVASQFAAQARSRTLPCLQADLEKATKRYNRVVELHDCWREELEQWTLALKTIILERFLPAVTHDNDPKFGIVLRDMEVSAFDCLWIQAGSNDADAASLILKELSTQLQLTLKCIHNYPVLFPAELRSSIGAVVSNDCCKIVDSYVLG